METLDNVFNKFFTRVGNVGIVPNSDIVKMTILSLVDDYGEEMVRCDGSYKRKLDDMIFDITGSSCLFGVGCCGDTRYDIGGGGGTNSIPSGCVINDDGCDDVEVATDDEIDGLFS